MNIKHQDQPQPCQYIFDDMIYSDHSYEPADKVSGVEVEPVAGGLLGAVNATGDQAVHSNAL